MTASVRIAGVIRQSIVDGPGLRLVLFTQGCPHGCPGCHNPDTHDFDDGYDCQVDTILAEIDKNPLLSGVTLSGGEPLCRAAELIPLAEGIRARNKTIHCYTGYTLEQLLEMQEKDPHIATLLSFIDILIDGPYLQELRDLNLRFRGSRNQRLLDLPASLASHSPVETVLPE